ncbi:HNH endonuclease [Cellulomonas shaoxiangyii]
MVDRPDLPCSGGCGKLMWRSSSTASEPKCRLCRRRDADWYRARQLGICTECDRPAVARGMCSTHYSYWHRRQSGAWGPQWGIPLERRLAIYERDGWTCQICGDPVDLLADRQRDDAAPSLDHIIPRSLQAEPDHSDSNLRLAHRGCNARRGAQLDPPEEVTADGRTPARGSRPGADAHA